MQALCANVCICVNVSEAWCNIRRPAFMPRCLSIANYLSQVSITLKHRNITQTYKYLQVSIALKHRNITQTALLCF